MQVSVCSLPSAQDVWHHGAQPHTILGQLLGCEEDGEHGLLQPQFLACPCDRKSYSLQALIHHTGVSVAAGGYMINLPAG